MMHPIIDFAEHTLGVKLYPGQVEALNAYYESGKPNWLLLSGRRGGKSLLSDIITVYEAVIPNLDQYIRPGEERYVLMVSVREDSARVHIRQITKLLRDAKRLQVVSDLYYGAFTKAMQDGDIPKATGYLKVWGWIHNSSIRAWEATRKAKKADNSGEAYKTLIDLYRVKKDDDAPHN